MRQRMPRLPRAHLLIIAALIPLSILPSTAAQANDPLDHAAFSWSGVYIGGNAGFARGDSTSIFGTGNSTGRYDIDGAVGGLHTGVQALWGNLLIGIEAQWLGTNIDGGTVCPAVAWTCSVDKFGPLWIVGPRAGIVHHNWLFYASGGWAGASITTRNFVTANPILGQDSTKEWHNGWALGGGIERALGRHAIIGLDYTHVDLADADHQSVTAPGNPNFDHRAEANLDMVRARLTIKFGGHEQGPPK